MTLSDVELACAELRAAAIGFYDTRHKNYQTALGLLTRAALKYGMVCSGGVEPPLIEREGELAELLEEQHLQGKAIAQLRADVNELTSSFNGLAESVQPTSPHGSDTCWGCGHSRADHPVREGMAVCPVFHENPTTAQPKIETHYPTQPKVKNE